MRFPRIHHLSHSPGLTSYDRRHPHEDFFEQVIGHVVITEKVDGENTTMTCDTVHARSPDSKHHVSRSWVKGLHGTVAHKIPEGVSIIGENLYAEHSIRYTDLDSYFMVFAVVQDHVFLSWEQTVEWCDRLGLVHVPLLYKGPWSERVVQDQVDNLDTERQEGFVVRFSGAFPWPRESYIPEIAKWVRADHVQTDEHWMHKPVVPNKLKGQV